jgi:hypothetical protein
LAVTVVLLLIVTVQVLMLTTWQPPLHAEKAFPLAVAGADRVTVAPESYVRMKLVVPFPSLLTSLGETVIATPLEGLVEFTIRT